MKPDAAPTAFYLGADLQERKPQRTRQRAGKPCARLRAGKPCARLRLLQRTHKHMGRRVQEQPKLVSHKPMATRPASTQVVLGLLDAVLPVSSGALEAVDPVWVLSPAAGGDKAHVELALHRLHFRPHPLGLRPALGLIEESRENLRVRAPFLCLHEHLPFQNRRFGAQTGIALYSQRIRQTLLPAKLQHFPIAKPTVGPQGDLHPGKAAPQQGDGASQKRQQAHFGGGVARPPKCCQKPLPVIWTGHAQIERQVAVGIVVGVEALRCSVI